MRENTPPAVTTEVAATGLPASCLGREFPQRQTAPPGARPAIAAGWSQSRLQLTPSSRAFMDHHVAWLTEFDTRRTLPSHMATSTPPECRPAVGTHRPAAVEPGRHPWGVRVARVRRAGAILRAAPRGAPVCLVDAERITPVVPASPAPASRGPQNVLADIGRALEERN